MFSKIKYLLGLAFFLNACYSPNVEFSSNETNLYGIKLDMGCLVGRPFGIIYLKPLLLFQDPYDNQHITVFDTNKKQFVRRFLSKGTAPGEIVPPLRLFASSKDKKIGIFQIQVGYLNIYEPNEILEKSQITTPEQIRFIDRPLNVKKLKDDYIGIGEFEDGRFRLYDSEGNIVASFGKYPFRGEEIERGGLSIIYQGSICTSVDGNNFAMGSAYCDNLEFYRIVEGEGVLINKYGSHDAKAIFYGSQIRIDDDCIMNYKDAYGGRYCYMLYSGKTYKEGRYGGKRIIVFDWDGNYLKSYKVDVDIWSFCVDEENNILYAIAVDDNDETGGGFNIFQFNLI